MIEDREQLVCHDQIDDIAESLAGPVALQAAKRLQVAKAVHWRIAEVGTHPYRHTVNQSC